MSDFDIIVGIHGINNAIHNQKRRNLSLYATDEGLEEFLKKNKISKKSLSHVQTTLLSKHALQERAKEFFKDKQIEFQRIPSQVFLIADTLEYLDVPWIYQQLESKRLNILCLDQITDVNNAAAILRTACFYGIDCLAIPKQSSYGRPPGYFRIASGATEYVPVVEVSSMAKFITGLNNRDVVTIALSEHESGPIERSLFLEKSSCLIVGKEDTGISNAVLRQATHRLAIHGPGPIKSLNVATAAAIAIEKCFGS